MQIKNYINKIKRTKFLKTSRYKKIRLDKNEKIDQFSNSFLNLYKSKLTSDILTAYPEFSNLLKLIANKNKINTNNILLTSGIDSAIKLIIEAFTSKKNKVLILNPTFAMTSIHCRAANLNIIKIGYNNKLEINFDELFKKINQKLKLIILSNPNSPTGTIIEKNKLNIILKKAKKFKIPVLIDEAYYGFTKQTTLKLISKFNNLFVTRTFSKVFGLAGLRAGFIASNKKNIDYLSKIKPMYEMNSAAVVAAETILQNERFTKNYLKETLIAKNLLIKTLKKKNFDYFDSHANFILIDFKKYKNKILKIARKKNILISKNSPFKNYTRVTLGPLIYFKKIINIINNQR